MALLVPPACVSDHAVEDDVVPSPGAVQPDGGSLANVAAAVACDRLKSARSGAATKLGCDTPKDECPGLLLLAGSTPCDEYTGGSVSACEGWIGGYEKCSDFSTKPCVVTPVSGSCHAPAVPDAAPVHDAGATPKDAASKG